MFSDPINRRGFLASMATANAGLAQQPVLAKDQVIGIQIGSISFLDEGTDKVLDILQEKACVNTLFLATFTYGNGIASRMIPGHPIPDHGVQEYDTKFHGGNYATPHPQYYKNTIIKDVKAPDHGNVDILEDSYPESQKARSQGLYLERGRLERDRCTERRQDPGT